MQHFDIFFPEHIKNSRDMHEGFQQCVKGCHIPEAEKTAEWICLFRSDINDD
jgi:hypothetical protein